MFRGYESNEYYKVCLKGELSEIRHQAKASVCFVGLKKRAVAKQEDLAC